MREGESVCERDKERGGRCGVYVGMNRWEGGAVWHQCLQAYGFIRILSGTKQENTEYGKLDIAYGFRRN